MSRNHKIILAIIVIAILGFFVSRRVSPETQDLPASAASSVNKLDATIIKYTHTDENEDEDLIITSDKKTYQGFSGATIYFSVNPLLKKDEKIAMQFYFTDPKAKIVQVYQYQKGSNYWAALPLRKGEVSSSAYEPSLSRRKEIEGKAYIQSNTTFDSSGETEYFMAEISYDPGVPGQFLIEALGESGSYGILDPWYDSGWSYRKKITINPENVAGALNNFPMLFSVTDLNLRATTSSGNVASTTGGDILFTDSSNTKLSHEIERYASTTGDLIAWVKIPFMSSTSTQDIYIYYGNATVPLANQQNVTDVWDSNYKGVWHLPDGTTLSGTDSTINAKNGTATNGAAAGSGRIDGGTSLDGTNDFITAGDIAAADGGSAITISAWINSTALPTGNSDDTIVGTWNSFEITTEYTLNLRAVSGTSYPAFFISNSTTDLTSGYRTTTSNVLTNRWYYITGVWNGGDSLNIYVNGINQALTTIIAENPATIADTGQELRIGIRGGGTSEAFTGVIDEVRVSNAARTANWINTEYRNQSAPNAFYSYSGEGVEIRSASAASVKVRGGVKIRGGVKFR